MQQQKKFKLLVWSDSVTASTGFGVVSKNVLKELYKTGKYDIHQLAVNYYGDFYDTKEFPYQLSPAKLLDPTDPFGKKMFFRSIQKEDYDLIWILNDIFVVEDAVAQLKVILDDKKKVGKKVPKVVYYYPIDCTVIPEYTGMLKLADVSVCITNYGKAETEKVIPAKKDIQVIYHGCDTKLFSPISKLDRQAWRAKYLGVNNDKFVFVTVNRNSTRKDIARTILAFSEFRKLVPNSLLYVHCAPKDNGIDLIRSCKQLGLDNRKDVVFPAQFNLMEGGFPAKALNNFYNAGDAFITTTLGEGWGLTITEAMAAGTPVIAPNNTSIPEILGKDMDRGFLYECKDKIWIDNSGYRPLGATSDIVARMLRFYEERDTQATKEVISRATTWVREHSWEIVCKDWIKMFDDLLSSKTEKKDQAFRMEEV